MDHLIERLRARAADPKRRTDAPQSISMSGPGGTLTTTFGDLGALLGGGAAGLGGSGGPGGAGAGLSLGSLGSLVADLRSVVAANQAGRPNDPDITSRVDATTASLSSENSRDLPAPADATVLDAAEQALGFALPEPLRRIYAEVADGGFGPGGGLMPIAAAVGVWRNLRAEPPGPRGQRWPERLLPLVDRDIGFDCLEIDTGRIVAWDPEELTERSGDNAWQRTFSDLAPSLEAWLAAWVDAKPAHEVLQERVDSSLVEEARRSRAMLAAKTPEERRAMGLPDVGWERVVWGGLGLEEDD